jgi:Flp pilus assembly protein TadG
MTTQGWLNRRTRDESGAEMVEFALIVVLLVTIVYGLVFFGLLMGAKVTITQAAADGARSGIVGATPTSADSAAANQSVSDLGWLGFSAPACGSTNYDSTSAYVCMSPCSGSVTSCTTSCTTTANIASVCPDNLSTVDLLVVASEAPCVMDTSPPTTDANTCLTSDVTYYDANKPIVPAAPGLNLVSPGAISSSSTLQLTSSTS